MNVLYAIMKDILYVKNSVEVVKKISEGCRYHLVMLIRGGVTVTKQVL